ncbi:MAG: hypothetical protein ACKE51_04605 [Methylococcaceae bacterium]
MTSNKQSARLRFLIAHLGSPSYSQFFIGCKAVKSGAVAVIGPRQSRLSRSSQLVIGHFGIPQCLPSATDPNLSLVPNTSSSRPTTIKMSPPDSIMIEAMTALIKYFGWTAISVLVENSEYGRILNNAML